MKKIVSLISLMFVAGLTACTNDSVEDNTLDENTRNVTLNFGMSSDFAPITRGSSNLSDFLSYINVYFYNEGTHSVEKSASQTSNKAGFGTMTVGLSKATYTVWAAGTSTEPTITNNEILSYPDDIVEDTFVGYGAINTNTQSLYSMNLNRAVAKICVLLTDVNIPTNVTKIRITHNGYTKYDLHTGCYDSNSNGEHIILYDTDKVNDEFSFLVFADAKSNSSEANAEKITFTMDALDANNDIVESKTFENVPVRPNYVTTYTGAFYADKYFDFSINSDSDWSVTSYDKTF